MSVAQKVAQKLPPFEPGQLVVLDLSPNDEDEDAAVYQLATNGGRNIKTRVARVNACDVMMVVSDAVTNEADMIDNVGNRKLIILVPRLNTAGWIWSDELKKI